jgi:hypothetical protein
MVKNDRRVSSMKWLKKVGKRLKLAFLNKWFLVYDRFRKKPALVIDYKADLIAPVCSECGEKMVKNGTKYKCLFCNVIWEH